MNNKDKELHFELELSKDNREKVIRELVDSCPELKDSFRQSSNPKVAFKMFSYALERRRVQVTALVSKFIYHFEENAQKAADFVEECIELEILSYDEKLEDVLPAYFPSDKTMDKLDLMMFQMPMVVEPKELVSNYDTVFLATKASSQVLNSNIQEDICLDVLNSLNKIPLQIDQEVVEKGFNQIKAVATPYSPVKEPNNMNKINNLTEKQFAKFNMQLGVVLDEVEYLDPETKIYIPWKYDKRGRFYDTGYFIKVQGNEYQKAMIQFADKHKIDK